MLPVRTKSNQPLVGRSCYKRAIGGIDDRRQSGKIRHAIAGLVRQRLYAIACG
jgi:hypothetical protein